MYLPLVVAVAISALSIGIARADNDSCKWKDARQTLRFYEYQGTQTAEGQAGFGVFRKMVDDEVIAANQYLSGIEYSSAPAVTTEPDLNAPFSQGRLNPVTGTRLFSSDRSLLEALDGFVLKRPQGLFVVHSNIYIPIVIPPMVTPITEEYVLDPDLYSEARSVHLAATYYALALEADQKACIRVKNALLNKAVETLGDVKPLTVQVKALQAIIRTELAK